MKKAEIIPQKSYKERYDMIRNPERIRSSDLIEGVFENLSYYESPDPSLIAAKGTVDGIKCIVLGQEKPRKGKESKATGMITAKGYGFTLDMLDLAEQKGLPVVSFIDTYGGDSRMDSELGGQSFLISDCISRFCGVQTPTTSFVIGEGGSGGALALQVADVAFMLENALYSVIAPESCCRIIFHKRLAAGEKLEDTLPDALDVLRPGAPHLKEIGMVDEILPEPDKGAHTKYPETIETIKDALVNTLKQWVTTYKSGKQFIRKKTLEKVLKERRRKVLNYGEFVESLDELAKRKIKRKKPDHIKTIDVEREDFHMMFLLKAHLESEGIDETEIYECEKEWDPDRNLFKVAGGCGFIPLQKYLDNYYACPKCGKGEYLSVEDQIEKLCDRDTFHEIESDLTIEKLVGSERYNFGKYKATLEKLNGKTFTKEGLITGTAQINGKQVVLVITDLKFFGGSFGAVFGEKFKRAIDFAVKYRHPFISVCASGGARMNEGPMSLAQMAKMNMSVLDLKREGLLYLSVITGPTTGGAYASYVTQGDIIVGEKGSLAEFAGPRVVTGAGVHVDRDTVTTDSLYETGKIQHCIHRNELKDTLSHYVDIFYDLKFPGARLSKGRIRDFRKRT